MVVASIAMWVLSLNGVISRLEGMVLFGSLLFAGLVMVVQPPFMFPQNQEVEPSENQTDLG